MTESELTRVHCNKCNLSVNINYETLPALGLETTSKNFNAQMRGQFYYNMLRVYLFFLLNCLAT